MFPKFITVPNKCASNLVIAGPDPQSSDAEGMDAGSRSGMTASVLGHRMICEKFKKAT